MYSKARFMKRHPMQHYDSKDSKFGRNLRKGTPDDFAKFIEWDQQVFAEEGHELSKKTRELIAIGVAATTQCPHCIEIHSRAAEIGRASCRERVGIAMDGASVTGSDVRGVDDEVK